MRGFGQGVVGGIGSIGLAIKKEGGGRRMGGGEEEEGLVSTA